MKRDEFDQLVGRMDAEARRNPRGFRRRVSALAALGYGYMLGVLLLTTGLALASGLLILRFPNGVTIKLGLIVGLTCAGMAWSILRALWVKTGAPEGVPLTAAEVPELVALVEDVGRRTDSPPFHEILLTTDYNAAVVQAPRLGVFGWYRNYLLLGFPLLASLSRDELTAVLAHEFGHLSRSHGQSGQWLYRMRRTWEGTIENLQRNPPGKFALLLTGFLGWFWPRFNAGAFVLSRAQEYEADATAAQATSGATLASALTRLVVDAPFLDEKLWPAVYLRANDQPEPPGDVFGEIATAFRAGPSADDMARWLRAGFLVPTGNADTHPSLTDRLRSLGCLDPEVAAGRFPAVLPPPSEPRALALLGDRLPELTDRLSRRWREAVAEPWKQRHGEAAELKAKLGDLVAAPDQPLSADELWQRAEVKLRLENDAAAAPLLDQLLVLKPDHGLACLVRGRHWLETDDPRGVELLERAMQTDATLTEAACQLLCGHFARTGQRDRQRQAEDRLESFGERQQAAQRERDNVTAADAFLPHVLTEAQLAPLRDALQAEPAVVRAHLARKDVQVFPENPCHVLAVFVHRPFWKPVGQQANQELVDRVLARLSFNGYLLVFIADSNLAALGKRIEGQPGSQVYARAAT